MSHADWIKATRKSCSQWAERFSVLAGEAKPASAMDTQQVADWATFVADDLGFPGQRRLFAVRDEALRNQIGRGMHGLVELQRRLVAAAEAGDGSETSQVMLAIDAALQRVAIAMGRIRDADVDEHANLPDQDVAAPSPAGPAPSDGDEEVTPAERPAPHLRTGRDRPDAAGAPRAEVTPRPHTTPHPQPAPRQGGAARPVTTPPPRRRGSGPSTPGADPAASAPRFKPVRTAEEAVIPLTNKKGDSALIRLPHEALAEPRPTPGPGATAPEPAEPGPGDRSGPAAASPAAAQKPPRGPLRPAATDPRVALLRTYLKRLDREVLGPEEDSALEQVLAILGGALTADEDTLARRFRYLDQQYAADDAAIFSEPLLRDLTGLLSGLAERAVRHLRQACELAQGDRLLFLVGAPEIASSPDRLPVVGLAAVPAGLREALLPSYLPRLRGPSAGFTFQVGTREGATLVRRVPENRLEFGFIAGPTRLWLTALHVVRNGVSGALNIEPGGDDNPAYFEARLTLPATEETYKVAQRFVLAETARFVDRIATA